MSNIDMGSIMKKVESYARSAEGKLQMKKCIEKYKYNGIEKTKGNGRIVTNSNMNDAANKIIEILKHIAQSYDLPDSVMRHFDSLRYSKAKHRPDGTSVIYIYFNDDLQRDSLYPDGYGDGVSNIIALLNNGYRAKNYVYGNWDNHSPTGEYDGRSINSSAYIRSRKDREGLYFIQQAIDDFNKNFGTQFNVTAVASDDYT